MESTKDGCASIAKAVVLSRAPDEALVVDVAGGLNSCDVVKQADGVLVKTASRVGNHREEGDVKTLRDLFNLNQQGRPTRRHVR